MVPLPLQIPHPNYPRKEVLAKEVPPMLCAGIGHLGPRPRRGAHRCPEKRVGDGHFCSRHLGAPNVWSQRKTHLRVCSSHLLNFLGAGRVAGWPGGVGCFLVSLEQREKGPPHRRSRPFAELARKAFPWLATTRYHSCLCGTRETRMEMKSL